MRLFLPPLVVPDDAGFSKDLDLFGRASIGAGLTNLVTVSDCPLVIAVDGQWGSGKSTFLKMWAGSLRGNGFPVIYFDAFASDYVGDAFMALAGEVIDLLSSRQKTGSKTTEQFVGTAVKVGKGLLRGGLKVGVKAATLGILAAEDLENIAESVATELVDVTDEYIGELITRQKEQRNAISSFRDALSKLPPLLVAPDHAPSDRPLIFIVDELDRCRPDFALEMLERMKHFFSVDNVHFVLGVHMGQLRNSVSAAYGGGIDAAFYLQKFINVSISLDAEGTNHVHEKAATKYINYLKRVMSFAPEDRDTVDYCSDMIREIADARGLSFRTIEQIFSYLALSVAYTPSNFLRPAPILAGLCVLKVTHPTLFAASKRGALTYNDVKDVLCLEQVKERSRSEWSRHWWRYCLDPAAGPDIINGISAGLARYSFGERLEIVPYVANEIIDRLHPR